MDFLHQNSTILLGAALAVSEALALIPGIQANSIFELILSALKKAAGK